MPTGALIFAKLAESLPDDRLHGLRSRLCRELEFGPEDFHAGLPLRRCDSSDALPAVPAPSGWLDSGIVRAYHSEAYPRGSIADIVAVADWIESNIAAAEAWYGCDTDGVLAPFPALRRKALLDLKR